MSKDRNGSDGVTDETVCVVATRPETFERCRDGLYPVPASYDRARAEFSYLGLYRTAPVSAITHYALVTDRTKQTRGHPGPLTETDWAATIAPVSATSTAVVFKLGDLVALDVPVDNETTGVRGAWYCSLADLRVAQTVSELRARL